MEDAGTPAVREYFAAALRLAGVTFSEDDLARLGNELAGYLADGRRLANAASPAAEPLPIIDVLPVARPIPAGEGDA